MLISTHWLRQYIDLPTDLDHAELGEELTLKVFEVEETWNQSDLLTHVVLGRVEIAEPHPNADSLMLCQVDVGKEELVQIVCGGSNVRQGMLVALAGVGAKVRWHGEGDLVELAPVKLRGEKSYGMICAAEEIGVEALFPKQGEKEILDLSHIDAKPGTPIATVLNMDDAIIEVENKTITHRPDLWGHYGIAREIAAMHGKELKPYPQLSIDVADQQPLTINQQAGDACTRATFVRMSGITIAPSPQWLKQRLLAVGVRPINNIVDITNFVMFDLGQPMHAHDATKFQGDAVTIRFAVQDEAFETLDKKELTLDPSMLVIADEKQAVALAGVMGGSASDVHDGTTDIILEAANFDATTVRKAALASGIRTDSSTRFEKTIDPEWTMLAIQRAVALIKEVCPEARVTSNVADWYEQMPEKKSVAVAHAFIEQKIGVSFSASYIVETLTRLGFEVTESEGQYHIQIPTWRATKDVAIKEDIVEEIARMYGFNQVPVALPSFPIQPAVRNPLREWCDAALDVLTQEEGFNEVYQYSFVSPETLAKLDIDDSDHIELDHPIAKDRPLVRKSLIPNLLETTERNQHRFDVVALLEVGKTFINDQQGPDGNPDGTWKLPTQREQLGLVFMEKGNDTPFFALAQAVEALNVHGLTAATLIAAEPIEPWMHPTRTAHVCVGDVVLGYIAELHPTHQRAMAIDHRVAVMQLDIPKLAECKPNTDDRYTPLSAFPSVDRDVALVVDRGVVHTDLHKVILDAHDLVVSAELFDVYMGEHMPADKKSMAYHVTLQSPKETLQAAQIDEAFDAVLKALAATGAELRTK